MREVKFCLHNIELIIRLGFNQQPANSLLGPLNLLREMENRFKRMGDTKPSDIHDTEVSHRHSFDTFYRSIHTQTILWYLKIKIDAQTILYNTKRALVWISILKRNFETTEWVSILRWLFSWEYPILHRFFLRIRNAKSLFAECTRWSIENGR